VGRVVITGIGVRTPLGWEPEALWARLLAGDTASREWPDLVAEGFPVPRACRIEGDLGDPNPARRGRALARLAAGEALESAGFAPDGRVGVYVGTTMGESRGFEDAGEGQALDIDAAAGSVFAAEVATAYGLEGPRRTYGTACAAGNYAIGAAAAAVHSGAVDAAVAGGVEPFSRIALLGFARSRAMSSDLCRPFDRARTGMQLGEAAAFVVLEAERRARARGAKPLAAVAGFGLSGDAFHPTAPRDDGSGMAAAMAACLGPSRDVGWVCAHGTATARSDVAEARALHEVFGDAPPPVSSLKGALGHSLGAATAVQAVVAVFALREHVLPPNANLVDVDESLGLDIVESARRAKVERVLSCGYAFGGLNSALLLEAA
jgi:3-oxoacyl-[acyl-carrier-protein] synthase II